MFFNSKPNTRFTLEWHFDDEMLNEISIVDDYNKIFSLKHLMLKMGYSNLEIQNYLKYSNPFPVIKKNINTVEKLDPNYDNIHDSNIKRSLDFIKTLLIENPNDDYLNVVSSLLISAMAEYICAFISFSNNRINDIYQYRFMLQTISTNNAFFQDDFYICLNIILKRYNSIDKFLGEYEKNKNLGLFVSFYKSLQGCIGANYLDGIIFKSIEYSLNNGKKYPSTKLFYKKDIEDINEFKVYDIVFKENKDCNKLFTDNFEQFTDDINKAQSIISEAYNLYERSCFNVVVPEVQIKNKNNYTLTLQLITSGGRKKKYPLLISFDSSIGIMSYHFVYSYKNNGVLDRIDIVIMCGNEERTIISKLENNKFIISEIKERNVLNEAFPRLLYKK